MTMVGDMFDNSLKTKSNAPYKALAVMSHKCPRLIAALTAGENDAARFHQVVGLLKQMAERLHIEPEARGELDEAACTGHRSRACPRQD
jgi:hypothetical protein